MKKITNTQNYHKVVLVNEIQNLFSIYSKKVKHLNSLFTLQYKKDQIAKEIKAIEKEIEHKFKIASMMRGY